MQDLGAQGCRAEEADLVDDGQSLDPDVAGRVGFGRGTVGVTEVGEAGGLVEAVVGLVEQVDGLPVARDGLRVLAEVPLDVAEAAPGVGLPVEIPDLLDQREGLPAVVESRPRVIAKSDLVPADVVEGDGLPEPVVHGPVVRERLAGVTERLPVLAPVRGHPAEVSVDAGLPGVVAEFSSVA